ncbi:MAG: oxidoreductase [Hyphomicrobiales bacterium]|nr:MAG: oxidoreductase [Hyphomicrobiales bacterium]
MPDVAACRIAFVGAGGMIAEHAKAFAGLENVEFSAIYNRSRGKAEELASNHGIGTVFDDLDTMLDTVKPDLVIMAVYEPAIFEVANKILNRSVALFMEKPIGMNLAEARKLHALAKEKGRKVWVGLNRRTLGSTQAALFDLAENNGPRFIHVQDQQSLDTARAIGHVDAVVENWMYANSIHLVDYLLAFGRGDVSKVSVLQSWDAENPGVVVAHVAFSSGDTGVYEGIWNGPGPWACTVSAPHRRWEMRPLEKAIFQNAGERSLNDVLLPEVDTAYKPGFRLQAESVLGALRGEVTGAATLDDALKSMELVAQIFEIVDR